MNKHWHAPRLRGRAGQQQRLRRLRQHPLCAECQKLGIARATDQIDHIVPLAQGGADDDDNVQGLCFEHHAEKTAREDTSHEAAASHPEWLDRSAVPLTIICGPPASGKTTYAKERAKAGDLVIDLDAILASIQPGFRHWAAPTVDRALLTKATRIRNSMLASLKRRSEGRAWFIIQAPTQAERDWWARKLGGAIILLHPGIEELKRRALARGTPLAIEGIHKWERKAKQPWSPPSARRVIGLDGWPIDPTDRRHP